MPEGASVFSSKPVLPVNEGNSTKNQTQSLISSSYSKAIHSPKVRTLREKLQNTAEKLTLLEKNLKHENFYSAKNFMDAIVRKQHLAVLLLALYGFLNFLLPLSSFRSWQP